VLQLLLLLLPHVLLVWRGADGIDAELCGWMDGWMSCLRLRLVLLLLLLLLTIAAAAAIGF
jgi:hypothetical protein